MMAAWFVVIESKLHIGPNPRRRGVPLETWPRRRPNPGKAAGATLVQQLYPAFRCSDRGLPKSGRGKRIFTESTRQRGNCDPCRLTGFFYFGGPQACACYLIHEIPNHYCSGFVARQTGLAQHPQRVIGFRKIQVVAHGLLTASLIKARRSIKFQRARE